MRDCLHGIARVRGLQELLDYEEGKSRKQLLKDKQSARELKAAREAERLAKEADIKLQMQVRRLSAAARMLRAAAPHLSQLRIQRWKLYCCQQYDNECC